jgi:hypothetical protein
MDKDNAIPASFAGKSGKFYVLRNEGLAIPRKYAAYPNVKAYDTRSETPIYVEAVEALADFDQEVKIYAQNLMTTPPSYDPDRDETDMGLTPVRNMWAKRFQLAKEGRSHAA